MNAPAAAWFQHQLDERAEPDAVTYSGAGALPSAFAVTDLAAGSIAAACGAVQRLVAALGGGHRSVVVDRRLASWWFAWTLRPDGWSVPPAWDPIAGDYPTRDGWIRLHTNAPHHRRAALAVLGVTTDRETDRDVVAAAVSSWDATELERAVVDAGGCAAEMRSTEQWASHEHGGAVALEPLLHRHVGGPARRPLPPPSPARPLAGVRVLDLTRVLAGPVATRFLAALGADVVRIDPPEWDEPGVVPEVTLGKRCYRVDLRAPDGATELRDLLAGADILVHGYRPGALAHLGLTDGSRAAINPGLIDVSLSAYGSTGPWASRRGFDSLMQMSGGIAHAGMVTFGADRPTPLPVQALDHATGYLLAMAAIDGWTDRVTSGAGTIARASLARTATLLMQGPAGDPTASIAPAGPADEQPTPEETSWGPAHRLMPPATIDGVALTWPHGARALGADTGRPSWRQ